MIYLLDKSKESTKTIKDLQNEIKILNDKNNELIEQLKQFGIKYYYSQNINDIMKPEMPIINVEDDFPQLNHSLNINNLFDKENKKYYDFSHITNYNSYNNKYNCNSLKSSQRSQRSNSNNINNRIY